MKLITRIVWGVVLIAVGVIAGLNALKITNIDLFFNGWWTLFIIIPCTISLFTDKDKTASLIGLAVGIALLLGCLDIINFNLLWKMLLPVIIIILGIKLLFGSRIAKGVKKISKTSNNGGFKSATSIFSGQKLRCDNEQFDGAELTVMFGGIDIDLTKAIFTKDVYINASAIFGGVDIKLPETVNVKVQSNSMFGGIGNKHQNLLGENPITVYVVGNCIFGGVDIK